MDLRTVLAAFRRWRGLMAALLLGSLVLAGAYIALAPRSYTASTTVYFALNTAPRTAGALGQTSTYTQGVVKTYSQVVTLAVVLEPVIRRLDLPYTVNDLADRISVDTQPDTVLATITVVDSQAERSARIADAVSTELGTAVLSLSGGSTGATALRVTTISAARVPAAPSSPDPVRALLLGLLAGLFLSVGGAVVVTLVTSRPVDEEAARRAGPLLGKIAGDPKAAARPMPVSTHPGLPVAESYRSLRTNLRKVEREGRATVLVISSAVSGEGRTAVAANLALASAQAYRKVLLIDADLRRSSLSAGLDLAHDKGLSDLLLENLPAQSAIRPWRAETWRDWNTLDVLPAGSRVTDPSELFARAEMTELLTQARARYDLVVLDAPPLLPVTDAALLAAQADGTLLVANPRRTTVRDFEEARAALDLAGAVVKGVVLVGVRRRRSLSVSRMYGPGHTGSTRA